MENKEKRQTNTKTTDTLGERGRWIRIGWLPVYTRQLTLLQIQEMAEEMEDIEIDLEEECMSVPGFVLTRPKNVEAMKNAIVISLFRGRIARALFGHYVSTHLTTTIFKKAYANIHASFDYDFFLQGLVFLNATKRKKKEETENQTTKEEDTRSETAPGHWWEA